MNKTQTNTIQMCFAQIFSIAACSLTLIIASTANAQPNSSSDKKTGSDQPVSFYKQIRPIFQQHCYGCHQGAKQAGQYVMTDFGKLLAGGETGSKAIVPGSTEKSYLYELIVPVDGEAEMPRDAAPLKKSDIQLIERWIKQGAKNDTPKNANVSFTEKNPPVYKLLPTVTSLDVSPDGKQIAVAGYHEVIIHRVEFQNNKFKTSVVARLIGLSERIETVAFSPDGKKLVVCGGSPARMGEIQIWDVSKRELLLSKQVGYDTLYGAAWSRDGNSVAFGCPDTTVRVINAKTGKQTLFNGAHNDWVLGTVFSTKNDHVITVSRDRSMKLIKVDTQRFIDNITSITPGALKGGLNAVDCHPAKDELLCGGADGVVKVYRMIRVKKRRIGDDFNLIRKYPKLNGRVFDTCFSTDGKNIVAVSSYNGRGQLKVFATDTAKEITKYENQSGGLFAADFFPTGKHIATSGFDGVIQIIDTKTGKPVAQFNSVPLSKNKKTGSKTAPQSKIHSKPQK